MVWYDGLMKKLLSLLVLSQLAFADEIVITDLIGKTWIESSAINSVFADHTYRFYDDGRFYGSFVDADDRKSIHLWNGAYAIRKNSNNLHILSDDKECLYEVSKIGTFYKLTNLYRSFSNICPSLLVKEAPVNLK